MACLTVRPCLSGVSSNASAVPISARLPINGTEKRTPSSSLSPMTRT